MPYQLRGKEIWSKSGGKWHKKQTCKSVANAKKALGLLEGLESGSITPAQVKARRMAKQEPSKRIAWRIKKTMKVRA